MKTKHFILMFAAMLLVLTINSHNAYCQILETNKYVDKSDELPGIIDGEVFLIADGVIAMGLK